MSLTLYFHPLSCYCQKVLVALYENGTPFTPKLVNLGDPGERADFLALWPMGKFPLLADGARLVPESSVIIEYLALHHAGPQPLVPARRRCCRRIRSRRSTSAGSTASSTSM